MLQRTMLQRMNATTNDAITNDATTNDATTNDATTNDAIKNDAVTNECYNERGSRTNYVRSSISHCIYLYLAWSLGGDKIYHISISINT
jgi:hypothetical protein